MSEKDTWLEAWGKLIKPCIIKYIKNTVQKMNMKGRPGKANMCVTGIPEEEKRIYWIEDTSKDGTEKSLH